MIESDDDKLLFIQFLEQGSRLLSSEGLYNPSMVQKLAAHFMQPEDIFTSQEPGKALFSFYQQAIELASQFDKLAPHLTKARDGAKPYPMGAIARLAGRLFCLTLHPCVDQGDPKWATLLNDFRQGLNVRDPRTVQAVVAAVEWLRAHMLERVRNVDTTLTVEAVNQAKSQLEGTGPSGSAVGICLGYCALNATVLLDGVAEGHLTPSGKEFFMPSEYAAAQSDDKLMGTVAHFLTMYFGARGGWREWRTDTKDLGEVLDEFIPADLASGVLMQWDGTTILPFLPDWYKGTERPEFLVQMRGAFDHFKSNHRVKLAGLTTDAPSQSTAPDGTANAGSSMFTKEELDSLLSGFHLRGDSLLSTEGLYNESLVQSICVASQGSIAVEQFDNHDPSTALFNFYVVVMELAAKVDACKDALGQARLGDEDDAGNAIDYPMVEIARIAAHLTTVSLHRAVEPMSPQGMEALTLFCNVAPHRNRESVSLVCSAVNWLRVMMVKWYRGAVDNDPQAPSVDFINATRSQYEGVDELAGGVVGTALAMAASNILAILQGAASGDVSEGVRLHTTMTPEQAKEHTDAQVLDTLLNRIVRIFMGARGGWKHWPHVDGDLGQELPGSIPRGLAGGFLMLWDDRVLVTQVSDWYRGQDGRAPLDILDHCRFKIWSLDQKVALVILESLV